MAPRYDAVIVGGRVAGASTALLLARAGARVALLERSPYGSDTLSTHALMRAGVLQLSRWGLLPEVRRAPARRRSGGPCSTTRATRRCRSRSAPSPGVDALYAPRRHVLDRILVDAAAAAGADVATASTVTGLLQRRRAASGASRHDAGRQELAAAGGIVDRRRRGPLRRGPGRGRRGRAARGRRRAPCSTGYYDGPARRRLRMGLRRLGAAAGMIPTNDGQTCVFVAHHPRAAAAAAPGGRRRRVRRRCSDTAAPAQAAAAAAAPRPVGRMHGWGGVPGLPAAVAGGRGGRWSATRATSRTRSPPTA